MYLASSFPVAPAEAPWPLLLYLPWPDDQPPSRARAPFSPHDRGVVRLPQERLDVLDRLALVHEGKQERDLPLPRSLFPKLPEQQLEQPLYPVLPLVLPEPEVHASLVRRVTYPKKRHRTPLSACDEGAS